MSPLPSECESERQHIQLGTYVEEVCRYCSSPTESLPLTAKTCPQPELFIFAPFITSGFQLVRPKFRLVRLSLRRGKNGRHLDGHLQGLLENRPWLFVMFAFEVPNILFAVMGVLHSLSPAQYHTLVFLEIVSRLRLHFRKKRVF